MCLQIVVIQIAEGYVITASCVRDIETFLSGTTVFVTHGQSDDIATWKQLHISCICPRKTNFSASFHLQQGRTDISTGAFLQTLRIEIRIFRKCHEAPHQFDAQLSTFFLHNSLLTRKETPHRVWPDFNATRSPAWSNKTSAKAAQSNPCDILMFQGNAVKGGGRLRQEEQVRWLSVKAAQQANALLFKPSPVERFWELFFPGG